MKMLKRISFLVYLLLTIKISNAQDMLMFSNGNEMNVKIEEVSDEDVAYKKLDNVSGPTYHTSWSELFFVKYSNGSKQFADGRYVSAQELKEAEQKAKAEAEKLAAQQKAEEERQRRLAEEARLAEQKAKEEAERRAAEEKARQEAQRLAEVAEAERKAEAARLEAEKRLAEENARLEAQRIAAEQAKLEAERIAAQARQAQQEQEQIENAAIVESLVEEELRQKEASLETKRAAPPKVYQPYASTVTRVILKEDFETPRTQFTTRPVVGKFKGVKDGFYETGLYGSGPGFSYTSIPFRIDESRDYSISADIDFLEGDGSNEMGLVWGRNRWSFFMFGINHNGEFSVRQYDQGELSKAYVEKEPCGLIQNESNKLVVAKQGSEWLIVLNDKVVYTFEYLGVFGNDAGFIIPHDAKVRFDNFTIGYTD